MIARDVSVWVLLVCLGFFRPNREFVHSYGDVAIAGEGLYILTYPRHSWPLTSKGSLACHTYCGHTINGHLRGPVTITTIAKRLAWICHYLFLRLRSHGWNSNMQNSACAVNALALCTTAAVLHMSEKFEKFRSGA